MQSSGTQSPASDLAVLIGNPDSVFCRTLAAQWRKRGLETAVVAYNWKSGESLPDGTPVYSSAKNESRFLRRNLRVLKKLLACGEAIDMLFERRRYERAMGPEDKRSYSPSFVVPIVRGLSIARCAERLRPRFVFGLQAFTYGPAAAFCRNAPRILMPWGGDIYRYAESSAPAFWTTRRALRGCDMVLPSANSAVEHMVSRFGLPRERARAVSWGVDTQLFRPARGETRRELLEKYGFPDTALVCMNSRRFKPEWGCFQVLDAFLAFARHAPEAVFFLLGGAGAREYIRQAKERIAASGTADRFVLFEDDIPLEQCAEVMSIADIALSLMLKPDMRSSSILQAAAAGACLVLSPDPEYSAMEKQGFRALYADPNDVDAVAGAMARYREDATLREHTAAECRTYIDAHEDFDGQMDRLLETVLQVERK